MNRMEMFIELKKDNSKRFRSIVQSRTVALKEYWVEDGRLYENYVGSDKSTEIEVRHLTFEDDTEYEEVTRPLWEVIEEGNEYWFVDLSMRESINFEVYSNIYLINSLHKEQYNMFRTAEEALAKAKEILKVLKN